MGDSKRRKVFHGTQPGCQVPSGTEPKTFKELGIVDSLCEACESLNYKFPTPIQEKAIPVALQNRDIIGLAETGSGKTAAFALPILQALLDKPQPLFGLVLAPTRELAHQIGQSFEALGSSISLRCAVIVGGLDMVPQAIALGKKPHIVVATPGRLVDHLEKTKGFSLRTLKYLVMDEADRLLDMDFGPAIDRLLKFIPRERRTYLFSATLSSKVESLQRASLRDPVRVSVSSNKYQTVSTLLQKLLFIPQERKDTYLVYLVNEFAGKSVIVFARTVWETQRIAVLLRALGFGAIPLHGQLSQSARLGALNKFRSGTRDILVATDVAARGLDISKVDIVLNYDLPQDSKTYIHRVGRTARAGKSGVAITFVTQYDIEVFQRIEAALGKKLDIYPTEKEEVLAFQARVEEAQRHARIEVKSLAEKRDAKGRRAKGTTGKRRRDDMDREEG
ncbi:ATP-dependent rRNA helicase RRP3 [Metarhizium album ARSEF 1941]|uniref:ATP-dependent rRNA helicase RRP3 n=1 Tax=Metarhizium album (strain ARSEF 1941) TaxID=1081103 RepID=A0A0B2WT00_METAS|nr:ATP-dependent rRNA helicase RRP3 [Metarhizium album ARSEF 1941]KHN96090.1 ATP-dependent rRNA helicase RRP3 [Metarhizium album ARSEF 1941]